MKQTKLACFSLACGLYWGQSVSDHYAEGSMTINKRTAENFAGDRLSFYCSDGSINLSSIHSFQNCSPCVSSDKGSLHQTRQLNQDLVINLRTSAIRQSGSTSGFIKFVMDVPKSSGCECGGSMFVIGYNTNMHGDQQIYYCVTFYHTVVSVAISSYKGGVA